MGNDDSGDETVIKPWQQRDAPVSLPPGGQPPFPGAGQLPPPPAPRDASASPPGPGPSVELIGQQSPPPALRDPTLPALLSAEPATIGRRISGLVIDGAVGTLALAPLYLAIGMILYAVITDSGHAGAAATVLLVVGIVAALAIGILQLVLLGRRGASIGRRTAGYRLLDANTGQPPGVLRALGYGVLTYLLSSLTIGIGLIVMAIVAAGDPRRRTWIDRATGLQSHLDDPRVSHAPRAVGMYLLAGAVGAAAVGVPVMLGFHDHSGSSGIVTAINAGGSTTSTTPSPADPSTGATTSATDPLGIGITFENQQCDGKYVLILGSSGKPADYVSTLEKWSAGRTGAKYLRTDESCASFHPHLPGSTNPIYATYLGPYDTQQEACQALTDNGEIESYIHKLVSAKADSQPLCACLETVDSLPDLQPGFSSSDFSDEARVDELQRALARLGYGSLRDVSDGQYDSVTEAWVRHYQSDNGLTVDGDAGTQTWSSILGQEGVCD